jgi:hypothetical protein
LKARMELKVVTYPVVHTARAHLSSGKVRSKADGGVSSWVQPRYPPKKRTNGMQHSVFPS